MTDFDTTTPRAEPTKDQAELNERELNEVAGGLLPAVGPASAKGPKPAVDSF